MTGGETSESRAREIAEFLADLSTSERELFEAERAAAGARLSADEEPSRVLRAVADALSRGSDIGKRHLQVLVTPQIACHEGCHWCCHLKVSVTVPEALALAHFIDTQLPPPERARIAARAAELATDPRIFSEYEKPEAKIPCALLTDAGACAAYEARPLACRGWNSADADACRRALGDDAEPIPMNVAWARECAAVGLGLRAAATDAGFSGEILELTAALAIALSTPNALERWLAGEALFAAARA